MLKPLTHTLRLLRIVTVLARHGAFPLLFHKPTEPFPSTVRLSRAFEKLGPSFIKLGQTLSTRPDVIGEDAARDLATLQDRLPPFAGDIAIAWIEKELGAPLASLFSSFDSTAIAAASIAQVHKAVTLEGKTVAVKILRPRIEKAFAKDLAFFAWIARVLEHFVPSVRRLKPREVVAMFAESVKLEMDLRFEAAAASELAENMKKDKHIRVPAIDWHRTSRRVMTLEWADGIPIHDREALLAAGHDLTGLANKLALTFFNQAYRDGFFHADMHPGNLFVDKDGNLVPVDFGIMGRLDRENRLYVAQILQGFLERDYFKVAEIHIKAGYVPPYTKVDLFAQACRSIGEPIIGLPTSKISVARLLAQLFKVTQDFAMETQPQLLLLQKTMVLVEGLGATLNPTINMWQLAEPWIKEWAIDHLGPEARIKNYLKDAYRSVKKLPNLVTTLEHVAYATAREGFRLHPETVRTLVRERHRRAPGVSRYPLFPWLLGIAIGIAVTLTLTHLS
ncbi:MAG: putative protein kinase UbiB [Rickettsiales bacterium]|jgi:ubiquinone biosynthesis protein|nr:putative protein kinase UbiB [Rickettsiales bacterium]